MDTLASNDDVIIIGREVPPPINFAPVKVKRPETPVLGSEKVPGEACPSPRVFATPNSGSVSQAFASNRLQGAVNHGSAEGISKAQASTPVEAEAQFSRTQKKNRRRRAAL